MPMNPPHIELDQAQIQAFLERVQPLLEPADFTLLKTLVETMVFLSSLVKKKSDAIVRLLRLVFGAASETSKRILKKDVHPNDVPKTARKGHGRNGAESYPGATRTTLSHPTLNHGDQCPECLRGKVYKMNRPGFRIRFLAAPPVQAHAWELEKLRCNLCGEIFTAPEPPEATGQKYDPTVGAIVPLLKYGTGLPFHRLEKLQQNLGVPLPASTQWEIVDSAAAQISPVYEALLRTAAQAQIVHNDDTSIKILALIKQQQLQDSSRKGMFTTAVVARFEDKTIACFFTGSNHAGENLEELLTQRIAQLPPPIQMCDASSRNLPGAFKTILANCLTHARRNFVDTLPAFPEPAEHVIDILAQVYHFDDLAREQKLSPEQRLAFHQENSAPLMQDLKIWLEAQLQQKAVEPNSSMGKAIQYMFNHWAPLTLFLRVPNAPLDNNICERVLKQSILHRKNSLFFKTVHGAWVGDLFMSLIATCKLMRVNAFDYLTALLRHPQKILESPNQWMPWNYQCTLAGRPP
jgi:transposase